LLETLVFSKGRATKTATSGFIAVPRYAQNRDQTGITPCAVDRGPEGSPGRWRDEYARLYGQRTEERFNSGAVPILLVANIRAGRKGQGRGLTPKGARALAEW